MPNEKYLELLKRHEPQLPLEHVDEIAQLSCEYLKSEAIEFSEEDILSNLYLLWKISRQPGSKIAKSDAKKIERIVSLASSAFRSGPNRAPSKDMGGARTDKFHPQNLGGAPSLALEKSGTSDLKKTSFSYSFPAEGIDIDSWRKTNTKKIFGLIGMHRDAVGLLLTINTVVNEVLTDKGKPGWMSMQTLFRGLYVPNGGSITYLSVDAENGGIVTLRLKGSEERPLNPSAQDEREIKLPVSSLMQYSLEANGVKKMDLDSVPAKILQNPLYALYYCAAKEVPEQALIASEFLAGATDLAFVDKTKQIALIRVPLEDIYYTEKELELMRPLFKIAPGVLTSNYSILVYSMTPEFDQALGKCMDLSLGYKDGKILQKGKILLTKLPSLIKAKKLLDKYSNATLAATGIERDTVRKMAVAKSKLQNFSDTEVGHMLSALNDALRNVDAAKAEIIAFAKTIK